jgi:hypothetical protein
MRRHHRYAILVLVLGLTLGRLAEAIVCSQVCCKLTNSQVQLDIQGKLVNCYQYLDGATSCRNCCGKGSAEQGFCDTNNCDPTMVCIGTDDFLQGQAFASGVAICQIAANYNEGICAGTPTKVTFTELRCICAPPSDGQLPCQ